MILGSEDFGESHESNDVRNVSAQDCESAPVVAWSRVRSAPLRIHPFARCMAMVVCSKCAKEAELNSTKLCAACNSFKTRLWRQLAHFDDKDPQIAKDFQNLSSVEKAAFWAEHHEMHGKDLALQILQTTSETRKKTIFA